MPIRTFLATLYSLYIEKIRFMPLQLREIGFHVENHATQWHGFQHEIQFQEIGVAWIQLTQKKKGAPAALVSTSAEEQGTSQPDWRSPRQHASSAKLEWLLGRGCVGST